MIPDGPCALTRRKRSVAAGVIAVVVLLACSGDHGTDVAINKASPDSLLGKLVRAYEAKHLEGYASLLDEEYCFELLPEGGSAARETVSVCLDKGLDLCSTVRFFDDRSVGAIEIALPRETEWFEYGARVSVGGKDTTVTGYSCVAMLDLAYELDDGEDPGIASWSDLKRHYLGKQRACLHQEIAQSVRVYGTYVGIVVIPSRTDPSEWVLLEIKEWYPPNWQCDN